MNSIRPKPHSKYRRLLAVGVIVITLAAAVFFIAGSRQQYLLLTNENSGKALLCLPAQEGGEFAVSFIHSVNKSPVTEYYRIGQQQIYLVALRYYTFGAGMPGGPEAGQSLRYTEDGAMIIEGFQRPLPYLCYIIGYTSNHSLLWQGREIPLNSLDAPGQPLLFSVVTLTRWQAAWLP